MGLTKANFKTEPRVPEKKSNFILETSWDDGWALDIKIASLLKKYDLMGVFYIIVDRVGNDGYLTWDQIKDLERNGFQIGSHTMSHPSDLKMLFDSELHYEIQNSKDMIEAVLNHPISRFCYPRGRYDRRVQEFVIKAGYAEARSTGKPGNIAVDDVYAIPGSIQIYQRSEYGEKSIFEFAKKTIDDARALGGYVNIFGHSKEIQEHGLWDVLEEVLKYAKG